MGLGWGGTYHHIRKLEQAGFVIRHPSGRVVRVYPAGTSKCAMEAPWLGETAQCILAAIREGSPRTVGTLAEDLGLPSRVLYYHLRRLTEAGLVQRRTYRYGAVQISAPSGPGLSRPSPEASP